MLFTHVANVNWSSITPRDEFKMQAVKDAIPHLIADLFLNDDGSVDLVGHNTKTTIQLVDTLPTNENGNMPLGSVAMPVQMGMKPTRELVVQVRVDQTIHQLVHTVAHEMEHVRQSYTAELVVGYLSPTENVNVWKGKAFSTRVIGYKDWPWEVAAEEQADLFMTQWADCLSFSVLPEDPEE